MYLFDRIIIDFDKALQTIAGVTRVTRLHPAQNCQETHKNVILMSTEENCHSIRLMRVNHVGEVCAQALYDAQGRFAHTSAIQQQCIAAAQEEQDHLAWTASRVRTLGGHLSWLNPLWYMGAYLMGSLAACLGDAKNLGFIAETERQVVVHLTQHLERLPQNDWVSRAIVMQMRIDEVAHAREAECLGAEKMPWTIQKTMQGLAKVMTTVAYYV